MALRFEEIKKWFKKASSEKKRKVGWVAERTKGREGKVVAYYGVGRALVGVSSMMASSSLFIVVLLLRAGRSAAQRRFLALLLLPELALLRLPFLLCIFSVGKSSEGEAVRW